MEELGESFFKAVSEEGEGQRLDRSVLKILREVINEFFIKWNNNEELFENGDGGSHSESQEKPSSSKRENQVFDIVEGLLPA